MNAAAIVGRVALAPFAKALPAMGGAMHEAIDWK